MDGVAQHLNLTPGQLNQLSTLTDRLQQQFQPDLSRLGQLSEKDRSARLQEILGNFNSQATKAVGGVLNEGQMSRFRQLELQRGGLGAMLSPDVQGKLNLSQDQQGILRNVSQLEQQLMQDLQSKLQGNPAAALPLQQAFQKAIPDMLGKVLSPQQMKNWRSMTGQPFNFPPSLTGFAGPSGLPGSGQGGSAQTPATGVPGTGGLPSYALPGYGQGGTGQSPTGGAGQGIGGGSGAGGAGGEAAPMGQGSGTMPPVGTESGKTTPAKEPAQTTPRDPFPEPLFRTDHAVRKLGIKPEQFDRLTTMAIQLKNRYRPEMMRLEGLADEKERTARIEEMLGRYRAELQKGVESILTEKQMASYRELDPQGRRAELSAVPELPRQEKPRE